VLIANQDRQRLDRQRQYSVYPAGNTCGIQQSDRRLVCNHDERFVGMQGDLIIGMLGCFSTSIF